MPLVRVFLAMTNRNTTCPTCASPLLFQPGSLDILSRTSAVILNRVSPTASAACGTLPGRSEDGTVPLLCQTRTFCQVRPRGQTPLLAHAWVTPPGPTSREPSDRKLAQLSALGRPVGMGTTLGRRTAGVAGEDDCTRLLHRTGPWPREAEKTKRKG